jgi:hypothetical protein
MILSSVEVFVLGSLGSEEVSVARSYENRNGSINVAEFLVQQSGC